MIQKTNVASWSRVKPPPSEHLCTQMLALNSREFLVGIDGDKICKYNSILDEWSVFLSLPKDTMNRATESYPKPANESIVIDHGNHSLFVTSDPETKSNAFWFKRNEYMMMFDMDNKSIANISSLFPAVEGGTAPELINVNGTIHKIGGRNGHLHSVWNETKHIWDTSFSAGLARHFTELSGMSVVFVPSKNILLMIGMSTDTRDKMTKARRRRKRYSPIGRGIWRFHIESGIWECIERIQFDFAFCGTVLTSNEEYVVITGGPHMMFRSGQHITCDDLEMEWIHILDIRDENDYKIWTSSIRSPHPFQDSSSKHVARSGGKTVARLMSAGWTRRLLKTDDFKDIQLPSVLAEMIADFCDAKEMIHWILPKHKYADLDERAYCSLMLEMGKDIDEAFPFGAIGAGHFVIPLDDILSSRSNLTLEEESETLRADEDAAYRYLHMIDHILDM